jgi:ubiquinol-cytochrome c reductase cytochrome b subunit
LLYLWPFLEARFTGDYGPHELLDRPTDRPARSAIGAGVLTFYIVLLFAASNDVIARMFQVPVLAMTVAFRIALFVIPLLVAFVIYRWFKAVKISGADGVMEVSLTQVLHPTPGGSHE